MDVGLLDVADDARPSFLDLPVTVHGELAVQHALVLAPREHVHQRRLHMRGATVTLRMPRMRARSSTRTGGTPRRRGGSS